MAAPKAAGAKAGGTTPHAPNPDAATAAFPADLGNLDPDTVSAIFDLMAEVDGDRSARWWRAGWEAHERKTAQEGDQLTAAQLDALARLREPFPAEMIELRPQVTCTACIQARQNKNNPARTCATHVERTCDECGSFVSQAHKHLKYIGHAQATNRLLDVDPAWNWEPVATTPDGAPLLDPSGGMWIRLTVCGMTRLGYGDAVGKAAGTTATKEIIGDAIRNAGMRFGMALDLWSKADLHMEPPHPAEPFVARIKDATVWSSPEYLAGVRREAEEAEQLDYEVPGGGGATLAQIIDGQLEHLGQRERAYVEERLRQDEEKARREQERKDAAAQVAAEHGVTPDTPAGAASPQTGQQAPDTEEPVTADMIRTRAAEVWLDPDALQQELTRAQKARVASEPANPQTPDGPRLGEALRRQINALRKANASRAGTPGAASAAGHRRQEGAS